MSFSLDDPLIQSLRGVLQPVVMDDDSHIPKRAGQRPASVLVPLVKRDEWRVLLTRRPLHMSTHAGQIAFPGGRTEAGETPGAGALRETREEVGVAEKDIHLLGRLASFNAVSDFKVTPFVGVLNPQAEIIPCVREVEEVVEVPFAFFMDKANHVPRTIEFEGISHQLYDMPWPEAGNPSWHVWGMTAMMLYRLYERLNP
ncbi:MAG: coenzyme A pyrophosphatase [Robiginitomaculum sp.]|nr:MAG: coenzyme A pyrophosphatase [Robiginitomaculum sp.]